MVESNVMRTQQIECEEEIAWLLLKAENALHRIDRAIFTEIQENMAWEEHDKLGEEEKDNFLNIDFI